jgi:hypothetical protein
VQIYGSAVTAPYNGNNLQELCRGKLGKL